MGTLSKGLVARAYFPVLLPSGNGGGGWDVSEMIKRENEKHSYNLRWHRF